MLRRDEIYNYICEYAQKHGGPTPSIRELALAFGLAYTTVYQHVQLLIGEQRLDQRDGKLVVIGAQWSPPDDPSMN